MRKLKDKIKITAPKLQPKAAHSFKVTIVKLDINHSSW